jgi:hypothetical protein
MLNKMYANNDFHADYKIANVGWEDNEKMSPADAADTVRVIKEKGFLQVGYHYSQAKGLAAAKIKNQLEQAGIKMIVRNKQGLDYFDPIRCC